MPEDSNGIVRVEPPPGLPHQLVADYVNRCRGVALEMRSAAEQHDFQQLRVLGHRMKGTGCAYGLPRLTTFGASIEQAATSGAAGDIISAVAGLQEFLAHVEVA
jgi:HPt (histidine-containing phosphotransfer) domain-containing protein